MRWRADRCRRAGSGEHRLATALGDDVPIPARPRKRAEFLYYSERNTGI
jgi:hypothetical protein